jgi:hypothetical protein
MESKPGRPTWKDVAKNNEFTPNSLKRRGGEIIIGERGEGKK